jgi:hypothetical protein
MLIVRYFLGLMSACITRLVVDLLMGHVWNGRELARSIRRLCASIELAVTEIQFQ